MYRHVLILERLLDICWTMIKEGAHQIKGATKLRHWKLMTCRLVLLDGSSAETIPATRRVNAATKRPSVAKDTKFQKPRARQETNHINLKIYVRWVKQP